jgi:hypothetical protein
VRDDTSVHHSGHDGGHSAGDGGGHHGQALLKSSMSL